MNVVTLILSLFGHNKNTWTTVSQVLALAGVISTGIDTNNTGLDDDLGNIMTSASTGLDAYATGNYTKARQIVDGIISALTVLRDNLDILNKPKVTPVNTPPPVPESAPKFT